MLLTFARRVARDENVSLQMAAPLLQFTLGFVRGSVAATDRLLSRYFAVEIAAALERALELVMLAPGPELASLVATPLHSSIVGEKYCEEVRKIHYSSFRNFFNSGSSLHPWHPLGDTGVPSGQMSHLSPDMPGLQMHLPLICSQSVRTDP